MLRNPRGFSVAFASYGDGMQVLHLVSESDREVGYVFHTWMELPLPDYMAKTEHDFDTVLAIRRNVVTNKLNAILNSLFSGRTGAGTSPRFSFDGTDDFDAGALLLDNAAEFFAALYMEADELPENWIC